MASALDGAPRASFNKIEFPFTSRSMTGEFRHQVHEFPNQAGGEVDKQGPKVWIVSYQCPFHASNRFFPNLYPDSLNAIQDLYSAGTTAELVIPEVGLIRAFITKFSRTRKGAIRSGEEVSLEFCEDDLQPFQVTAVPAARATLVEAKAGAEAFLASIPPDDPSIAAIEPYQEPLGSLLDLVQGVLAIRDQVALFGARVGAMLAGIASACQDLHELLKGPDLSPLRESLRDLWDATTQLQNDLLQRGATSALITYVTPTVMSVGAVAQALYKDASRGGELLALNPSIVDPFAVRAATKLRAYAQ